MASSISHMLALTSTERPQSPPSRRSPAALLAYGLIGIFLLLFFAASVTGPDFDHYLWWARAFEAADTMELWDAGQTLSPLGVPLSQWSHGPGLIFASLCPAVCRNFISMDRQAMITGMLFTAALWWAMFRLLRRAGAGDLQWAVYGVVLAILGMHLGFYSRSYASETFSQAALALLAMWVVTRTQWRWWDALVAGCLTGLLAMSRSQLLIYALPFFGIMYRSAWQAARPRKLPRAAAFVVLSLLPLSVALAEVAMTNRWMTGSVLGSAYSFGNAAFRSLDFARPEVGAVLLHPWHGLLTHHPLYAVGFAALIVLIVRGPSRPERLFWLSCAGVIILHVYLQAAWYVWWLGMQTFGMRGLGISAVILVPALIHMMRQRELRGKGIGWWAAAALASCLWSAPLFLENLFGETQFLTYTDLFRQYTTLVKPLIFPFALIVALTLSAIFIVRSSTDAAGLRGRFAKQLHRRPALTTSLMLLVPLTLYCLTAYVAAQSLSPDAAEVVAWAMIPLGGAWTFIFLGADAEPPVTGARTATETVIAAALIALFGVSALLFARLAHHTDRVIASRTLPEGEVRYVSAAYVPEVTDSYFEYLTVPGFDDKKAALKAYAEELMACAAVSSPDSVLARTMGPPRHETQVQIPFGADLVLTGVGLSGGKGQAGAAFGAGDFLGVQTRWQIVNAVPGQKFSLRLEDAQGQVQAAADYVPQVGCGDGGVWQPVADITDRGGIPLSPDLPPGFFTVKLVVYDPETLAPLQTVGGEQQATLATVEVTAAQ